MLEILMTVLITLMNKTFLFAFFIGCLYTLRQTILFAIAIKNGNKYEITHKELVYLGGSVAIILTIIFSGINLI